MALQAGGRNKTLAAAETVGIGVEAAKAGSLGVDNGEGEGEDGYESEKSDGEALHGGGRQGTSRREERES